LISEYFGSGFARSVAQRAEYVWNEDCSNDPFAKDLLKNTIFTKLLNHITKGVISAIFGVGFALGWKMKITKYLV